MNVPAQRHRESDVETRERLAAIVDSSDDAIVSKNLEGVIQSWNRGAERIFGYTAEEAVGRHISLIIPEHLRSQEDDILATLRAGRRISHFETIRQRKDGTLVDISLTVSPVHGPDGRVVAASKVARDITEQKAARRALSQMNATLEERVRQRTEQLERSMREVESFNHAVAHDLRTPLRAILGFSRMLAESPNLTQEEQEHLKFIVEASEQMNRITQALLALSTIRPDRIQRSEVDLSALAQKVVDRVRASDPGRKVETEIHPGLRVWADPTLTEVLLENLLRNAWKFTAGRDPARIRVGTAPHNGKPMFFVQDNGVGFNQEEAAKILRGFHRLRPREFEGSGIGLTTVNRITDVHGGLIDAEGTPGEGATIWFSLN